jgi:hypothetical protein
MNETVTYNSICDMLDDIADATRLYVETKMKAVKPSLLGLEGRCASILYIDKDCIAVKVSEDKLLQYYGGFEYVDRADRHQAGSFVFYFATSDRISRCLTNYEENIIYGISSVTVN